ncbi:MAG: iron ABC transporter permease, partial [Clostridia bacterium]|nr:iron ABC transporter permease [Clostridia bacterium]
MERRKRRKNEYPENQAGTLQSDSLRRALAGRRRRCAAVFALLLTVLFCLMVLSLCTGSVSISPGQVLQILFLREGTAEAVSIIRKIRLPRLIMAAELGGALSVSGFLLQTYFANPIAGPSVLGISSGAKMAVSFSMVSTLSVGLRMSSLQMVLAAFAGALLITGFVVLASHYVQAMSSLLVAGIMAGYICSAVTDFIVTFADDSSIVNLHNWSRGSFSGMSWEHTAAATAIVCFGLLA